MIRTLAPFIVAIAGVASLLVVGGSAPRIPVLALPVLLALALMTTVAGVSLPRMIARLGSLRHGIVVVGLAAMVATGAAIAISVATMLVDPSDVPIVGMLAVIGGALGIILEYTVARDIARDVRILQRATKSIARGDLDARASLDRRDELGQAARALDDLADRLSSLEHVRSNDRAARRNFMSALGHDLRTPITALRAAVEALQDGVVPDPPRYLASMRRNVEAIGGLVDDLFLLARIESSDLGFDRVPNDLSELVDDAVEALTPTASRKGMTLRVESPDRLPVRVGPGEISRIVRNLLENAIRHAGSGSEVVVKVEVIGTGAVVRVIDQGSGIPDEVRKRLFDGAGGASTVGERGEGSGLGLMIARGLVAAHGGDIWAERGPGGHVAFRIPME